MTGQTAMGVVAAVAVLILGVRAWTSIAPARVDSARPASDRSWRPTRRRTPATELDVAAWCDDVAREIRTGASLTTALRAGAGHRAVAPVTEPIVAALGRGQPLSAAGYSPTQAIGRLALDAPEPVRPAFAAVEQRMHRGQTVADALGNLTTSCGRCALPLVNATGATVRDSSGPRRPRPTRPRARRPRSSTCRQRLSRPRRRRHRRRKPRRRPRTHRRHVNINGDIVRVHLRYVNPTNVAIIGTALGDIALDATTTMTLEPP